MKKYVIIAAFVLLVAVLLCLRELSLQRTQTNRTTNSAEVNKQSSVNLKPLRHIVTYTQAGFEPNELTIQKGDTVTFVSNSDAPLWVASDPHPEHTNYPEFDVARSKGGQMPRVGENFSFTFNRLGTWAYHNHTASSDTGNIGVHPGLIIVQ